VNKRLAASLREVATVLDKKGPDELSQQEILTLQRLREMLSTRLHKNAITKGMHFLVSSASKLMRDGKYRDQENRPLIAGRSFGFFHAATPILIFSM
jgi:hypothetical protein